jgi:hypothetical protein
MRGILNGRRVVGLTLLSILVYVLWRGPERFCVESVGTWILSPSIYVRLLPEPLSHWLLAGIVKSSWVGPVLCVIPMLLLTTAAIAGFHSLRRNSLPYAFLSMGIVALVFSVYHYVQPMGITLVYI